MNLSLFFLGIFLITLMSCTQLEIQKYKKENTALSLIENFYHDGAFFEDIKKILGKPDDVYKGSTEKIHSYKNNNLKEWSFGVNNTGSVAWLIYNPVISNNSLLSRIEILPQTWKKYHCRKKRKPDTRVHHVIRDFTFFECAGGKIKAYYNKYGEIRSISVDGPR